MYQVNTRNEEFKESKKGTKRLYKKPVNRIQE